MKKNITALLLTILCLTACVNNTEIPANYINTLAYCQIDGTIYRDYGLVLRRFSNAFPEGSSLCFDPLCSHSKEDFCAEMNNVANVVTDGKRLYIKTFNFGTAEITALNPDGSGRQTMASFSTCDGLITHISTDGEYVYYVEGLYKEPTDSNSNSYGVPMRVPCKGGEAEAFLDGEYTAYAEIYSDGVNYYITDAGSFTVIDQKNGNKISVPLPCVESCSVIFHGDSVYLYGLEQLNEYEINSRFMFQRNALWKWNGTDFEEVITDIDQLIWDEDGVWYTPMLDAEEFVLVGSKESYDGKGMSLYDFIRTWTGELVYHELASGEETVYKPENINLKIEPVGAANGYIIAAINDYENLTHTYEKVNLKPEANGTVSIHGAINTKTEDLP